MKSVILEIFETVVIALVIFLVVQVLVQNYRVTGFSMEPTVHDGELLLVNKAVYFNVDRNIFPFTKQEGTSAYYAFHAPRRGDVIVFHPPFNEKEVLIKRVIAVPGETVEIKNGLIYINGVALKEPDSLPKPSSTMPKQTIAQDFFFVMGDNRDHSNDSRFFGPVPRQNILGKAWLSIWPLADWGGIPHFAWLGGSNFPS